MSRRHSLLALCAGVVLAVVLGSVAQAGPHPNSATIVILDSATPPTAAALYPSAVTVSGETNVITKATVTITGFSHNTSDDVDILLDAPSDNVLLMSDAGGFNASSNLTFTFDQTASGSLPDSGALSSGTFKPSAYGPTPTCTEANPDTFPAPAPAGPYLTSLSALLNEPPNGTYNLFVVDDCSGDPGSIQGGWTLTLTTGQPVPTAVALRSFSSRTQPGSVALRWHTASESTLLGFNVYRTTSAGSVRVNRSLIRARAGGTIADARYVLVDRAVHPGRAYTYRLQAVGFDGSRAWLGTAAVRTAS